MGIELSVSAQSQDINIIDQLTFLRSNSLHWICSFGFIIGIYRTSSSGFMFSDVRVTY